MLFVSAFFSSEPSFFLTDHSFLLAKHFFILPGQLLTFQSFGLIGILADIGIVGIPFLLSSESAPHLFMLLRFTETLRMIFGHADKAEQRNKEKKYADPPELHVGKITD